MNDDKPVDSLVIIGARDIEEDNKEWTMRAVSMALDRVVGSNLVDMIQFDDASPVALWALKYVYNLRKKARRDVSIALQRISPQNWRNDKEENLWRSVLGLQKRKSDCILMGQNPNALSPDELTLFLMGASYIMVVGSQTGTRKIALTAAYKEGIPHLVINPNRREKKWHNVGKRAI